MNKNFKRIIMVMSLVILLGATSILSFAEVKLADKKSFDLTIEENEFTITFAENPSTGYAWNGVTTGDMVELIDEKYTDSADGMVGSAGTKSFTYKVNKDGVSTILFSYARSWEETSAEEVDVLVYMNNGKLFVEENAIVNIDEGISVVEPVKIAVESVEKIKLDDVIIMKAGNKVETDVSIHEIDGVTMIPLAASLESKGYTVIWNDEAKSVEISKGAKWTSIYIGKNSYFKNRMAAIELSAPPVIVDGRTLVPAEFFSEILSIGVSVENGRFTLLETEAVINSGYVKEINEDKEGNVSITISSDLNSNDFYNFTVVKTRKDVTIFNKDFTVGDYVNIVCSMMSTRSLPPQTPGYILY